MKPQPEPTRRRRIPVAPVIIFDRRVIEFHGADQAEPMRIFEIFSPFGGEQIVTADPQEEIWCVPVGTPEIKA